MVATSFDAERTYDEEAFSTRTTRHVWKRRS